MRIINNCRILRPFSIKFALVCSHWITVRFYRKIISNYELRGTQFGHRNYDISSTTAGWLPFYNGLT